MKKVIWHPKARDTVRSFPEDVKRELGYLIFRLQMGDRLTVPFSRSMASVSSGVQELRVKGESGIYRAFYFVKTVDRILVFHAFQKKVQKTPKHEIRIAQKRLKELLK